MPRIPLPAASLLVLVLLAACPDARRRGDDDTPDDDAGDDDGSPGDDDTGPDDDDGSPGDDDTGPDDDDSSPESPCDAVISRLTNIGCEFWAVDLDNAENVVDNASGGQFAVAVANVHDTLSAHVDVFVNDADPGDPVVESLVENRDVAPGDLYIFDLPRRDADGDDGIPNSDGGPQTWLSSRAFRIQADAPIVAYQFNTIDQQYSNDASVLLPTHALGTEHVVLSWPPSGPVGQIGPLPGPANRGYVAVVGVVPGTTVDVTPSYEIFEGPGVDGGIAAGDTRTFSLGPYDLLNLETILIDPFAFPPPEAPDLTGTLVTSYGGPVAVFTGTDLSMVLPMGGGGDDDCCAEHLEEQVLPTRALRSAFVVSRSAVRNEGDPEVDVYRVLALEAGTSVTTSLPGGDASFALGAGEWRDFESDAGFVLSATAPVQLAQFLVVGTQAGVIGDSSMMAVPPVEQRRGDYTFTTGEGFSENWAVISAVEGTELRIDGIAVGPGAGCSGPETDGVWDGQTYVAWTCDIADGVHRVHSGASPAEAEDPLAVYVYGYYNAGSYAYPAGAGLD